MAEISHTPRVVMVTGGAGFIGSNFVRHLLAADPAVRVINYDALTYAGTLANLEGVDEQYASRYRFIQADICDADAVRGVMTDENVDTLVHLAAESHVDRSIAEPGAFLQTNVMGTYNLLEAAREVWKGRDDVRFHHVGTDEVYGSLEPEGYFTEETPYNPSSPYSASKAASDHLVSAWARTYGVPATLSLCSNNYGPYQFPEKLLPLMMCNALLETPLPVYGDGKNVRDWLHVEDHCRALDLIVRRGEPGRSYNIGGNNEWRNIDVVELLCDLLQKARPPKQVKHYRELITFVPDRPGHDRRYAIDAERIRSELGWTPAWQFEDGLAQTLRWYLDNQHWLDRISREKYDGRRLGLLG
ncbi:MAG TPA: dTDP-glucose 4,6-dehydratase [Phycisphaerae bacterium]|nr:dTDP-glucose 4,6-dehydratase [Phycisphaerae bacterium]HDZ42372.1 dTDP-glucose 4,6-dehydratase [Phycisphaerae bacterium]